MKNHKIVLTNYCIADVCFRNRTFFNTGKVVIDVDTYNFAGIITHDKIVGYFEGNEYQIFYAKTVYDIATIPFPFSPLYSIENIREEELEFSCGGRDMTGNIIIDLKDAIFPLDFEHVLQFKEFGTDLEEMATVLRNTMAHGLVEIRK